jgi:hypothetical protein
LIFKKKKSRQERLVDFIGDETISGDTTLIAAVLCLMESSELAIKNKDIDALLRTARAWYDVSKDLLGIAAEEENKTPFGFGVMELAEVGEEDGVESDKSSRRS